MPPALVTNIRYNSINISNHIDLMAKYCVVKQGSSIVWTDEVDISKFLPEGVRKGDDGRPIAYRDAFIENTAKKAFAKYMTKVRNPHIYGRLPLRDPLFIRRGVHFNKKGNSFS